MVDAYEYVRLVKYSILQMTTGPSLLCDLFVFIYFLRNFRKEVVNSPQNHTILCLLLISFIQKITDVPLLLYYLRWGYVLKESYVFCQFWNWLDYSFCCISAFLITLCSLQRHLFIFHQQIMKKQGFLIIFHYIPLIVCLIYGPIFYFIVIFFPSQCENVWDYTLIFCSGACYSYVPFLGTFDWLFHYGSPMFVILIVNLCLFFRVIEQKLQRRRIIDWRRQKRMIVQLAFISILYFTFMLPEIIVGVIEALWDPTFLSDIQYYYFYYMAYFVNQFLPFIIVGSLPNIHKQFREWILFIKRTICLRGHIEPL
ncbi:unnamed protein product [Adineta ricciae]|uniref:G-protein coupled receptors family 1 profile domain-containing protein n=1 Tax=Adineta ricciae TaxID=249248 RepID=A0A814ZMD6_ADIRI|nr:unnamed protein product [Adineta ricciae]CAF1443903.1 unnamed protein product [Adineta ricciae]